MLSVTRQDRGTVAVVCLSGHLDALTVKEIKAEAERVIAAQTKWCVLDLSGVVLVDSTGIGSIISLYKRLRAAGGDLRLSGVRGQPKEIFDLLRLERALTAFPDVAGAYASFTT